ncbi:MAG: anthranilate synthase component I [Myxococcota bacterium]|nr:anthranilate synthase component I [Myxococcota bacterium]
MLRPSAEEFVKLSAGSNWIPVVREILADLDTPLSLFRRMDDERTAFLFESVEGGEKWARYSFIGSGARAIFRAHGSRVEWTRNGETETLEAPGDPLDLLRQHMAGYDAATLPGLPRFTGGAVGMVGWDWVRFVEDVPDENPDELGLPDLWFVFPETVVVYDNIRHTAQIIVHAEVGPDDDPAERYAEAILALDAVVDRLRAPLPAEPRRPSVRAPMDVRRSMEKDDYLGAVKKAIEYVEAGDIFQVVLSQRYEVPLQVEPFLLYRHLRHVNPSPYLFFMRMEGPVLIGSSPEILVRLEDGQIDLRPIAGTRRRGRDPEDDLFMERELLADPKERAEHVMLVDLGRNDVGRVARIGSVEVTDYALIERYSHVMHIVSNVQGRLVEGRDWLDLLRACFPAGTLSGAPKVRAMEIIDELETVRRGFFGGCVGYVDYSGNMDFAITIRTMLAKADRVVLQAGAGIVADSIPELEHKECGNKAGALIEAIDRAREGVD